LGIFRSESTLKAMLHMACSPKAEHVIEIYALKGNFLSLKTLGVATFILDIV
jgi:hypothetical protein